jgi:hypothetical protein
MRTLPESPEQLVEELFTIFPEYRVCHRTQTGGDAANYHSVLRNFTCFFGAELASFTEVQLRAFGDLVSTAVAAGGSLENAFGTCLLEHLQQIRASRVLRPYLSERAREKAHA